VASHHKIDVVLAPNLDSERLEVADERPFRQQPNPRSIEQQGWDCSIGKPNTSSSAVPFAVVVAPSLAFERAIADGPWQVALKFDRVEVEAIGIDSHCTVVVGSFEQAELDISMAIAVRGLEPGITA